MVKNPFSALKYETGIATLIQLFVVSILAFFDETASTIKECSGASSSQCGFNAFATVIIVLLIVFWFIFIWVLGFMVQARRSQRLTKLLILAELGTGMIALGNLAFASILGKLVSLADLILGGWVVILGWRILKARGGRIVVANRQRHSRPQPK